MITLGNITIDGSEFGGELIPQARRTWGHRYGLDKRTEEMERLAARNLGVQTLADLYERSVEFYLRFLTTNPVGGLVLSAIQQYGHRRALRILPLRGEVYAEALGFSGGDAILGYSPETWWHFGHLQGADPLNDFSSDDVLLHELVHAMNGIAGKTNKHSTVTLQQHHLQDIEEFSAVLITNLYLSCVGRDYSLRGDHRIPFHRLPANLRDPDVFARVFDYELDYYFIRMDQHFVNALVQLPCRFNPVTRWKDIKDEEKRKRPRYF